MTIQLQDSIELLLTLAPLAVYEFGSRHGFPPDDALDRGVMIIHALGSEGSPLFPLSLGRGPG